MIYWVLKYPFGSFDDFKRATENKWWILFCWRGRMDVCNFSGFFGYFFKMQLMFNKLGFFKCFEIGTWLNNRFRFRFTWKLKDSKNRFNKDNRFQWTALFTKLSKYLKSYKFLLNLYPTMNQLKWHIKSILSYSHFLWYLRL